MATFNTTDILINKFVEQVQQGYIKTYGGLHKEYSEILAWAANMALEIIAGSDALYHNVEHTILVTLVGQEILRGKHIREGHVAPEDWLHFIISLLCHDIGYVKGVCKGDKPEINTYCTGEAGKTIILEEGSTDAGLTHWHVERGVMFIQERFGGHPIIDAEKIKKNIMLTKFPVPAGEDSKDTKNYPGLVRAADLLGQLSDSRYLQKIAGLYYEFVETGTAESLGYKSPGDLKSAYPKFYWNIVFQYVQPALEHLNVTQQGKAYISQLYSNVFRVEHQKHIAELKFTQETAVSAVLPKQ